MNRLITMRAVMALGAFGAVSAACNMTPQPPDGTTQGVRVHPGPTELWQILVGNRAGLEGWRGYKNADVPEGWQIVNGSLVLVTPGSGDIITRQQFSNFDLRLEWKVAEGGNSGIFYRATEEGDYIWQSASEMQILDDARHPDGKSELTSAGSNFALYGVPRGVSKPAGEWNTVRLLVDGNHVEHWLNGVKVVDYDLGSAEWEGRVKGSKFATMPLYGRAPRGHIGLQDHGDRVEFRNIVIRELP